MILRKALVAAIACVGVLAASDRSKADTTIQIIEGTISTSGGVTTFSPSGVAGTNSGVIDLGLITPPGTSIPLITTNDFKVLGTVGLNIVGNSISLSTALNLTTTSTGTIGLEVLITNPDLTQSAAGSPATFTNDASGTFAGGTISAAGSTTVAGVTSSQSNSESDVTTGNITSLPSPFSITQTLLINVTPPGSGAASFTSDISSVVNTNAAPVPAPGGLALALLAVPVLGLRRILNRKSPAPAVVV